MRILRSFNISNRAIPAFLLLIALLAFGPLLPWLGFYWDDWAKILVARLWGLGQYAAYYAEDRPFSAWTHQLFTPLLGLTPPGWQIFTLLLRWLSAWGMLWCLNQIWPAARRQNLSAALLFLIYPVFTQQPAAVTFFQQWLQYALFFLSLGAMLRAARGGRLAPTWTLLALLAMAVQFSVTEYFLPLELIRPLALWFALAPTRLERRARAGRVLRAWAPFALGLLGYVAFRLFFLHLPGPDPYKAVTIERFFSNPLQTLVQLAGVALVDLHRILLGAWYDPFFQSGGPMTTFTWLALGISILAGLLALAALWRLDSHESHDQRLGWVRPAVLLGAGALLLGPVPAWVTGRQVVFDGHSDRYALPAMFGAALLVAGWIEWLARGRLQRALLAASLISLGVGVHLYSANTYRWTWTEEQRFFWQLTWRAPGLKAPTALYLLDEPFPNQGLFSSSAALNLVYPQPEGWGAPYIAGSGRKTLAYWFYTLRPRYAEAPTSFNIKLNTTFRTLHFEGQALDSLLLFQDGQVGGCLWVLSARDRSNPYLPQLVRDFLPIANLDRIDAQARATPPVDLLGPEPLGSWCFAFETADLARQQADWPAVARLYDTARAQGFQPGTRGANSAYEWLPFIEGLVGVGRWNEAAGLSRQVYGLDKRIQPMLCTLWSGLGEHSTGLQSALSCEP